MYFHSAVHQAAVWLILPSADLKQKNEKGTIRFIKLDKCLSLKDMIIFGVIVTRNIISVLFLAFTFSHSGITNKKFCNFKQFYSRYLYTTATKCHVCTGQLRIYFCQLVFHTCYYFALFYL